MLLSKLKIKSNCLTTSQDTPHFHLDQQQQQLAFEAKRQLQECSHQMFDDNRETIKTNMTSFTARNKLRESTLTKATENEGKTIQSKAHFQEKKSKQCKKCRHFFKRSEKSQKQEKQSPKYGSMNSINLENNFSNQSVQLSSNRFITKIQTSRKRKLQRSGFYGVTFRSYTLQPQVKEGLKMRRLHSSKKDRIKRSIQQLDQTTKGRLYTFNDTMDGVKQYQRKSEKTKKVFDQEQVSRPASCRGTAVNLRPQFIRLIMKIKEKEEMNCKLMVEKGRTKII